MSKRNVPIMRVRLSPFSNPTHHMWFNNGTSWWVHYTIWVGPTKERRRENLHTRDLNEAMRLRDIKLGLTTNHRAA